MDDDDDDRQPVGLSTLDMLACSFGAAVLLAFVFMAVRQAVPNNASASRSLQMTVVADDQDALVSVVLQRPGSNEVIDIDLTNFKSGELRRCPGLEQLWCMQLGFRLSSDDAERGIVPGGTKSRVFVFHLLGPEPVVLWWLLVIVEMQTS